MFLGKKKTDKIQEIDLRDYMNFVLAEGIVLEKRAILDAIRNKIILLDKVASIGGDKSK